ncbi:MAG: YqaE/Pmp3 family membrane protein [Candidatus Sumerlaeota bacterium]|nr:YqaE/Pmp3 family membrane protein [Candidatus Sumerlaeota bacterium]
MGLFRAIVCIIFPPLAVIDKGCGSLLLVSLLTLAGWIPGVIGAIVICMRPPDSN